MNYEICISGFGGQGILSFGQIISYSAMIDGKETSWMPSYGPEMRGGTANCIVIVSDKKISSPIVSKFDALFAFNQPSIEKFESKIKKDGLLFYEETTIVKHPSREDLTIIPVNCLEIAIQIGNKQIQNMVMLGAFLGITNLVSIEAVKESLKIILPTHKHGLIDLNLNAIEKGKKVISEKNEIINFNWSAYGK